MDNRPEPATPALSTFRERYRVHFERWVHGRIPPWARATLEPASLVRETFDELHIDLPSAPTTTTGRREQADGPLLERVRRSLYWKVLSGVQRVATEIASESHAFATTLPLRGGTAHLGLLTRYEASLDRLAAEDRQAIIARTELALPWSDVAYLLDEERTDGARTTVSRALLHLAREMAHAHTT